MTVSGRLEVELAIVGGGPAGIAILAAAQAAGTLDELVDRGVCVIDPDPARLGAGALVDLELRSDTTGKVFAESAAAIAGPAAPALDAELRACDVDGPVELERAASLLMAATAELVRHAEGGASRELVVAGRVHRAAVASEGVALTVTTRGGDREVRAQSVVIATGGRPWLPEWAPSGEGRRAAVHSDAVIRSAGVDLLDTARVLVVGGSHSAFAATNRLLRADQAGRFDDGAIAIVHRRPIRVTYPDLAAAFADGMPATETDVCPLTSRVHRFGGLRGDSAALWRRVRDGDESRVRLVESAAIEADATALARDADLVVMATGYGPDESDWVSDLRRDARRMSRPIAAIGLGARHRRTSTTGGEPSFAGSIDGVWFYRSVVAPPIVNSVLERARHASGD